MAAFKFPFSTRGQVGVSSDMQKENVRTFLASGVTTAAATKIGFGQPVIRGATPKTIVPFTGTGSVVGITLFSGDIDDEAGYPQGENVPVINEGQVWVYADGACTAGKTPLFVPATGGFKDATTGEEPLALKGCVFDGSGVAGDAVRLQVFTRIS